MSHRAEWRWTTAVLVWVFPFVSIVCGAHPGQAATQSGCPFHSDKHHVPTHISAVAVSLDLICFKYWDRQMELMICVHSFCLDVASIDQLDVLSLSTWQLLTVNGPYVPIESCRLWNAQGHGPDSLGREVFHKDTSLVFLFKNLWPKGQWLVLIKNLDQTTFVKTMLSVKVSKWGRD